MRIILGRSKTGKSNYIYEEINREINKNTEDNLVLIVPDLMTYQTEYDIIQRLNLEGIMSVEILSFKRVADKILGEIGENKTQDINPFGKIMLLKQIFEESRDELKLFKKASGHGGFLKEFNLLIKELKQNLISQDSLEEVIKNIDNTLLKNKLSDIGLIYSKYNEKIKDKFLDEEDRFNLVISIIKNSNYIKDSKIWIDGFESLNQQRIKMIKTLSEYSKGVTMSLNIDKSYLKNIEDFDDWEAFKTIYDTFTSIESTLEGNIEIIPLWENKILSGEIKTIEKNIFAIDIEPFTKPTDNITIYSSMNTYTEVEKTAQKIISLVRDYNYRWQDIKIAVGDMESYIINIRKVFDKFDIPYFLDIKRDIMNNPVSKYILSILDIFIWNFRYDDVFQYLKTGLTPLNSSQINYLENHALQYGVESIKWFQKIDSDALAYIEDIRKLFVSDFIDNINEFKKLSTISEITAFIFEYLKLHRINEKMNNSIDNFLRQNKYEESSEYAQVWNRIMEVFEQILLIGEDIEITPLEYRKILEVGLKEVQISIIPPTIDRVGIGDIERIAVSKPRALFVLGANEKNLDSNKEKGLLSDEERETILDNNIKIISGSSFSYFKDKHMLYKVFSSPTEKLFISYALGTIEGKSMEPSLYVDTLKRIFPSIKEETDISCKNQLEYISNYNGTYDILVENMREYIDGGEIDDIWKAVYIWYRKNYNDKFHIINKGFNYINKISKLEPEIIRNRFNDNINITVSKLERYAECQFKYFVENILKPNPRLIQKIEFFDIGNINHAVLEDFINKLIAFNDKIDLLIKEDIYQLVEESIEKVFSIMSEKVTAFNANNRNNYLKKKISRILKRTAYTLVKQLQSSEFRPKYTELQIGIIDEKDEKTQKGIYIDSLEISSDNYSINLRGIIDRVDIFEDTNGDIYLSIIDYKSSKKDIDFTDTYEGIQIQLLVYLNAIINNGEKLFGKKPKIAGVFYYHVDDPIIKGESEDIEEQILKSLKLKGFVLKNKDLIYKIDRNIGTSSNIIPVGIKKDGDFTQSSNVLTEEEFDGVLSYVDFKITELSSGILSGNFYMNPYRKKDGNTPCKYCDYISICQFDKTIGNEYRQIKSIKKEDFFDKISVKGGN